MKKKQKVETESLEYVSKKGQDEYIFIDNEVPLPLKSGIVKTNGGGGADEKPSIFFLE